MRTGEWRVHVQYADIQYSTLRREGVGLYFVRTAGRTAAGVASCEVARRPYSGSTEAMEAAKEAAMAFRDDIVQLTSIVEREEGPLDDLLQQLREGDGAAAGGAGSVLPEAVPPFNQKGDISGTQSNDSNDTLKHETDVDAESTLAGTDAAHPPSLRRVASSQSSGVPQTSALTPTHTPRALHATRTTSQIMSSEPAQAGSQVAFATRQGSAHQSPRFGSPRTDGTKRTARQPGVAGQRNLHEAYGRRLLAHASKATLVAHQTHVDERSRAGEPPVRTQMMQEKSEPAPVMMPERWFVPRGCLTPPRALASCMLAFPEGSTERAGNGTPLRPGDTVYVADVQFVDGLPWAKVRCKNVGRCMQRCQHLLTQAK